MDKRLDLAIKELDIALDNRVFEIQSFWQRSNYFLVLLTALGAATFAVSDQIIQLLLAILSAICSYLWYRTNLGSKFWQESWEVEVNLMAEKIGIASFERPMEEVIEQVKDSLDGSGSKKGRFKTFLNKEITSKPSVTTNMIVLSLMVTATWSIISIIFFARQLMKFCEYSPMWIHCSIS